MARASRWMAVGALLPLILLSALAMALNPTSAYADGPTTVKVESVTASPGETVRIAVSVENNPGILGAVLKVSYDEGLTLSNATNGDAFSSLFMAKSGSLSSPCKFSWDGEKITANDIKDGEILVLTFDVSENAEMGSVFNVSVSGDRGAIIDGDLNVVDVAYSAGTISVSDYMPGDLDGDKIVNSKDVIYMRRHIVGSYVQTINVAAADVNNDRQVNSMDVILLRRYVTGGYGVDLSRSDLKTGSESDAACNHTLEAVPAHDPTCTENGNIAYWHCTSCDQYFSDKQGLMQIQPADTVLEPVGHTPVIDPAVAPTRTTTGLTEGSHCSVCGEVLKAQAVVPALGADEYFITYDISNGDSYLASQDIANPNKTSYFEGDSFRLIEDNITVDGYQFLGWYDGAGDDATKVTRIAAGTAEDLKLYGHWRINSYTVQYQSDVFLDAASATYTVDKGLVLPTPKLSNYVFVGWTDDEGKLYERKIPAGTTGNITLAANWTSERNKTYTNPNPTDPIIYEDEDSNVILFAYEIGRIENVPLYTIKDFGYISGDGVVQSASETYVASTSKTTAETVSNVVAKATTNSSNWTLSSGWNETTSISEEWCKQNGYTKEEAETVARSDSKNWNVSNSAYGSTSSTKSSSSSDGWTNEIKLNGKDSKTGTDAWKVSGELNGGLTGGQKIGANVGGSVGLDEIASLNAGVNGESSFGWNVGLKVGGEYSRSTTNAKERGFEAGGTQTHTGTNSSSVSNTAGWNSTSSYGGSSTTSKSQTVATAISESISQKTGYGKSYCYNGNETQGLATSNTNTQTDGYTAATTYNTASSTEVTSSWTTAATKAGYHRWVVAGTAHVFGVVGYDIETKSFFVYTYSVMDDATHEFEDYSCTTAAYNDNENGVISFEVPYDEVMDVVSDRVYASDGFKVDLETGTIEEYAGTDTCVIIPEYYNAGNGDVVKITGLSKDAFAGNTDIVTVVLSDYITEIPDGAFAGCTSLAYVNGTGVTSIGSRAFAGCSSMEDCGVYSKVTHLGESAFAGAEHLYVNASNADVARAAITSGARSVTLNLGLVDGDDDALNGCALNVPSSVGYFELNGDFRTFNGLTIDSKAAETSLNKVTIVGDSSLPVKISSGKVTLNQTNISSPGIALALTANSTQVGLRGTSTVMSTTANAVLCRNVTLYETANNIVGKLVVPQKLLKCGSIDGSRYLQCSTVETIDEDTFSKLLNTYLLHFNAGEGTCDTASREIVYGVAVGELPIPTREYCTFDGWYLEDGNTLVTESTVLPIGKDVTLVAHWTESWTTDIPDGVYSLVASADAGYSIDMPNGSESAGTNVALYKTNGTWAQRFRFTQDRDGSYKVSFVGSGLTIGAYGSNQYGLPYVRQEADQGLDSQRWYICKTDDGWYSFRNKGNGLYIDIANGTMANGALIQCHSGNGSAAQKFNLKKERYATYNSGLTWEAAKQRCERMGGHLAVVTSSNENAAIVTLIIQGGSRNCYWLGGYRNGSTWSWVTGESFSYKNWAPDEPNSASSSEDAIMMYGKTSTSGWKGERGQWNDLTKAGGGSDFYKLENLGFVCEWEDVQSSLTSASSTQLVAATSAFGEE